MCSIIVIQILMSSVQSVSMHSAVICKVCSLGMFVVVALGDYIVEAYSSMLRAGFQDRG